jgi:hypothetical protein
MLFAALPDCRTVSPQTGGPPTLRLSEMPRDRRSEFGAQDVSGAKPRMRVKRAQDDPHGGTPGHERSESKNREAGERDYGKDRSTSIRACDFGCSAISHYQRWLCYALRLRSPTFSRHLRRLLYFGNSPSGFGLGVQTNSQGISNGLSELWSLITENDA